MKTVRFAGGLSVLALTVALASPAASQEQDPRKDASDATVATNDALLNELPFSDTADFTDAHKGFIAALPSEVIKGEAGNVIWDPTKYGFIKEGDPAPATVNPSLWRNAQLINISGLFEVADGIYQVRNHDLSNMTIIEGGEGITIVDPLVSAETAKAASISITPTAERSRSRR